MNKLELQNCPFCGSSVRLGTYKDDDEITLYHITCYKCGVARTSKSIYKEPVINQWEKRTPLI